MFKQINVLNEEQIRELKELAASAQFVDGKISNPHSRVKNNLQVISSLLTLQAQSMPDAATKAALLASQGRVSSMSLVHEMFYQSGDLKHLDLEPFLRDLTGFLRSAYDLEAGSVEVRTHTMSVLVTLDTAIHVGLVVNELVTNSLKHAFPARETPGLLEISLSAESDSAELVVADNGCGLREGIDWTNADSLGLQLVQNLAGQLRGTISLDTTNGTAFRLQFPIKLRDPAAC